MRGVLAVLGVWALAGQAVADPAQIRVQPTTDGVRVEYRLPEPTSRFAFETPLPSEARVTAVGPGLSFAPDAVTAERALTAFTLDLRPDRVRMDAAYPVLTRVGEGWMVYLPALQAAGEPGEIVVEPGPGWALVAGPGTRPLDGFVYLGPAAPGAGGSTRAVVDPVLPGWLTEDIASALETSNDFYAAGLALPAPGRPVLIMGALPPEDRATFVGDVTPNGVINLQFAPAALPPVREPRITAMVAPFVAHETFHVWQRDLFRETDGINGRWLTEGSAEYFSLLAQAALSPEDAARSRDVLARRLGACLSAMDSRPQGLLRLAGADAEGTRYDCGTVSQWLADLEMRDHGGLFGVWRALLTRPEGFGVAEFRNALKGQPSAGDAGQAALLDGAADIRAAVLAALNGLGAGVEPADPGPAAWAGAALWPLLESNCSGQMGIRTEDNRFFLDTGQRCGALSGDLRAVSIDGRSFDTEGEAAFHAVETACAGSGVVSVGLVDGDAVREAQVSCRRPAKRPAAAYRIPAPL